MEGSCYLLLGKSVTEEIVAQAREAIREGLGLSPESLELGESRPWGEHDRLFLLLDDEEYRRHITDYAQSPLCIVPLPTPGNPRMQQDLLIPKKLADAVALATPGVETTPLRSLTLCNGEMVLGDVTLGEVEWLRSLPVLKWFFYFLSHFMRLRLRPFSIETAKGRVIETAALIIPVAHERIRSRQRPYFFSPEENFCSRVAAVIYAPLSLLSIFRLRIYLFRPGQKRGALPMGVGTLKSRRLTIRSAGAPMPLYRDGKREYVAQAVVESVEISARILLPKEPCVQGDPDKESIRLQSIPTDKEIVEFYTRRRLPLVPIAPESLFADLFSTLRDGARGDAAYWLLLIVSVLMATTGLFQNSSPTIIGAMILAPLMAPIISFSMGVMRFDASLLKGSAGTLSLSVILALLTAAALAWFLPFSHQTAQMTMRTHPTLLDLAVAILSGIAAAYGYINTKVGQSLAGVAIAVALVPPLSVAGIGLGWGDYAIFEGAFLLFLANFAGIIIAAGTTFYLMGFTSWRYASSAFIIKLLLLLAIAFPLWLSTQTLVREEKIHRVFDTLKVTRIAGAEVQIHLRQIYQVDDRLYAEVLVLLPQHFDDNARRSIIRLIREKVGKPIHLVIAYRYLY